LIKFDADYHGPFITNRKRIVDYSPVSSCLAIVPRLPGVAWSIQRRSDQAHPVIDQGVEPERDHVGSFRPTNSTDCIDRIVTPQRPRLLVFTIDCEGSTFTNLTRSF
jgi:hypothetical protein